MKSIFHAILLSILLTLSNAYVQELTDNNFFAFAKDKDVLLVDFYAPWCSDCKVLEPEFEKAAAALGQRSMDLAKVDCFGAGKGLCQMYGIKSWPQLKNFNKGTHTGDYNGPQTGEALASYINTVEGSVTPVASNPYAMSYPVASQSEPETLPGVPIAPAPPVVGALSCAKCNILAPTAKINKHCSKSVKKACVEMKLREKERKEERKYDEDDKKRTFH